MGHGHLRLEVIFAKVLRCEKSWPPEERLEYEAGE